MNKLIYADFNGVRCFDDVSYEYIDLCGYGTLSSLSYYKIKLEAGLKITFFEPGDIEVDAIVKFIPNETDKYNHLGKWFGKYEVGTIRNSKTKRVYQCPHLCFKCRYNLEEYLNREGRQYNESCPVCNTSIMYPLLPPKQG